MIALKQKQKKVFRLKTEYFNFHKRLIHLATELTDNLFFLDRDERKSALCALNQNVIYA